MTGQLQFNGMVPFIDRNTGSMVNVQVWGVFVGSGVDAHEESAIQHWILQALATSAQSYAGAIEDLPAQAQQWGSYVSAQLGPQLSQQFQAHGQLHIQGVSLTPQQAPAQPMAAEGMGAQGMGAQGVAPEANVGAGLPSMSDVSGALGGAAGMVGGALGAVGGAVGALAGMGQGGSAASPSMSQGGGGVEQAAIGRLTAQLGLPHHTAQQAVATVMDVLRSHGMLAAGAAAQAYGGAAYGGANGYAEKQAMMQQQKMHQPHDPYAKKADPTPKHDPYAKKTDATPKHDPYGKGAPAKHDPYADKGAHDPYGKGAPAKHDPYGKGAPAKHDPYADKGAPAKHDPYGKGAPAKHDPYADKGAPAKHDPYGKK